MAPLDVNSVAVRVKHNGTDPQHEACDTKNERQKRQPVGGDLFRLGLQLERLDLRGDPRVFGPAGYGGWHFRQVG